MCQTRGHRLSDILAVFPLSEAQLVLLLQVQPEVWTRSKPLAESQVRFRGDCPLTVDDLHDRFGGRRQGDISTPKAHLLNFLFTGESGEQYGHPDGWVQDGAFRYFGNGQVRDMRFVAGNRAIGTR
jgi:hypothetical protein